MWDNLLLDFLYLSSDSMTGKSIPILYAITIFHLDPHLLGTIVLLGACIATAINVYKTYRPTQNILFDWIMRFLQFSLSSVLSLALLGRFMFQMHPNGVMMATIPCFWVVIHGMPEKPITLQTMSVFTFALFYLSLLISPHMLVEYPTKHYLHPQLMSMDDTPVIEHQRALLAMTKKEWKKKLMVHDHQAITQNTPHPIQNILPQCFYILILTVYACTLHGPLYAYTGKYCSPALLVHRVYACFICFLSCIFKAYLIISIAWMQNNIIHIILEGDTQMKFAIWMYMLILMLSVNWNVTQVTTQLLTLFKGDQQEMKILYTISLFAVAYMHTWASTYESLTLLWMFQIVTMTLTLIYY